MESLTELFHTLREVLNPKFLIDYMLNLLGVYVYLGLWFVVFAETGLAVGFFLPGDSLLVTAGILAAAGQLDIAWLLVFPTLAAIAGDQTGYAIGRTAGAALADRYPKFRKQLDRAHAFYEQHGTKTIVIARFVPIIRTFAPFVAGIGTMSYRRFAAYNVVGGVLWVTLFLFAGYFFGGLPMIRSNFTLVIFAIIFLSILPPIIELIRDRLKKRVQS